MKYVIELFRGEIWKDMEIGAWEATAWGGNNRKVVLARAKEVAASVTTQYKKILRVRVVEVLKDHKVIIGSLKTEA